MFNTNKDKWKDKYYQAVEELDKKEKSWKDLEAMFRKGIGRLAIVAEGDNDRINSALKDVRKKARKEDRGLEKALEHLETVLLKVEKQALEAAAQTSSTEDNGSALLREAEYLIDTLVISKELKKSLHERLQQTDVAVREVLRDLTEAVNRILEIDPTSDQNLPQQLELALLKVMETLHIPAPMLDEFSQLAEDLEKGVDLDQWSKVLEGFSGLASRSISAIAEEKNELEEFLRQLTGQISEMESFVGVAQKNVESSRVSNRQIQQEVSQEVNDLEQDVNEAEGIDQVKQALNIRIQKIRDQMQQFVEVEETRLREFEENNQSLTQKLSQLDEETSKLKQQLEQKHQQLLIDPLTRISNRFAWEERSKLEYERWKRTQNNLSVAVWDIDKFKSINDTYGHKAGDRVLKLIAKVISSRVRKTDFFARIGGEEFAMLLPDTELDASLDVLNILREYVESCPFNFHGKALTITISCGVTKLQEGDTMESVFERADQGLYKAKELGRNRCVKMP